MCTTNLSDESAHMVKKKSDCECKTIEQYVHMYVSNQGAQRNQVMQAIGERVQLLCSNLVTVNPRAEGQ